MKINPEADRLIIYFIIMPVRRSSSVSGQHCMELHPHFRFRYLPKGTYRSVKSLLLSLSNIQLININMTMTRQSSFLLIASALSSARPSSVSAFSLTRLAAATSTGSSSGSPRTSTASSSSRKMSVLDSFFGKKEYAAPCVMGDESIMSPKSHGTSETPVQKDLRWKCDYDTADRICNFNRWVKNELLSFIS